MNKILLVEDESDLAQLLQMTLELSNYEVRVVANMQQARNCLLKDSFHLVMLDRMLPDGNGVQLCSWLRQRAINVRVLMLTAMGGEDDILSGLRAGADDYVVKPFSSKVLLARVEALLRREQNKMETALLEAHNISLNRKRHQAHVNKQELSLTVIEFDLLEALLKNIGCILSREQLLEQLHYGESYVSPRTIDVHILSLRRKLGVAATLVETVRGLGYRLRE